MCSGAGDNATLRLPWSSLEMLHLEHNNITSLDDNMKLAPLLHTLTVSHNEITSIGDSLRSLTCLNTLVLSFNQIWELKHSSFADLPLTSLNLAHNTLYSLDGLQHLPLLVYLDVSHNKISAFEDFAPLEPLAKLRDLVIAGNPVTSIGDHRIAICQCLRNCWKTLRIDGELLSPDHSLEVMSTRVRRPLRTSTTRHSVSEQANALVMADVPDMSFESRVHSEVPTREGSSTSGHSRDVVKPKKKKKDKSSKTKRVKPDLDLKPSEAAPSVDVMAHPVLRQQAKDVQTMHALIELGGDRSAILVSEWGNTVHAPVPQDVLTSTPIRPAKERRASATMAGSSGSGEALVAIGVSRQSSGHKTRSGRAGISESSDNAHSGSDSISKTGNNTPLLPVYASLVVNDNRVASESNYATPKTISAVYSAPNTNVSFVSSISVLNDTLSSINSHDMQLPPELGDGQTESEPPPQTSDRIKKLLQESKTETIPNSSASPNKAVKMSITRRLSVQTDVPIAPDAAEAVSEPTTPMKKKKSHRRSLSRDYVTLPSNTEDEKESAPPTVTPFHASDAAPTGVAVQEHVESTPIKADVSDSQQLNGTVLATDPAPTAAAADSSSSAMATAPSRAAPEVIKEWKRASDVVVPKPAADIVLDDESPLEFYVEVKEGKQSTARFVQLRGTTSLCILDAKDARAIEELPIGDLVVVKDRGLSGIKGHACALTFAFTRSQRRIIELIFVDQPRAEMDAFLAAIQPVVERNRTEKKSRLFETVIRCLSCGFEGAMYDDQYESSDTAGLLGWVERCAKCGGVNVVHVQVDDGQSRAPKITPQSSNSSNHGTLSRTAAIDINSAGTEAPEAISSTPLMSVAQSFSKGLSATDIKTPSKSVPIASAPSESKSVAASVARDVVAPPPVVVETEFDRFPFAPATPFDCCQMDQRLKLMLSLDHVDVQNEDYRAVIELCFVVRTATPVYDYGVLVVTSERLLLLREQSTTDEAMYQEILQTPLTGIAYELISQYFDCD